MTAPRLTTDAHIQLFRILREAEPRVIFTALAQFYDSWNAVLEHQQHHEQAAECAVARDSCEVAIGLLGELDAANELRIYELVEQLRASIAQRKAAAA